MYTTTHPPAARLMASDRTLRMAGIAAMVLAPVVFLIGQALLPSLPRDLEGAFAGMTAHRDQLVAARLLTAVGAFLFVPAVFPIWWLAGRARRAGAITRIGAALLAVGSFFNAVSQVVRGYAEEAATTPGLPSGAGLAVYRQLGESAAGIPIAYWSIPVFALGCIVVALGLLVSRGVPVWIPILLWISVVLSLLTAGAGPIVAVGLGAIAVAFTGTAVLAVRRGYTDSIAVVHD